MQKAESRAMKAALVSEGIATSNADCSENEELRIFACRFLEDFEEILVGPEE